MRLSVLSSKRWTAPCGIGIWSRVSRSPRLDAMVRWYATAPRTGSGKDHLDLSQFTPDKIRNFSIIAHIDHGKSTLADRLLEHTGTIQRNDGNKQVLDKLKVERERGITVKAQTVSMFYSHNGELYVLNLIDTPGHVDFSYEVSRSLAACQGAILLVDASQGIQAQTVANFFLAFGENLTVVPVLNKVDLPSADAQKVCNQIESTFELPTDQIIRISAKTGVNVDQILPMVIDKMPPPEGDRTKPFKALLFDTWYDQYLGVICLMAVKDGVLKPGEKIVSAHSGLAYEVTNLGLMYPEQTPAAALYAGQVGYVILGMKTCRDAHIGDTFYHQSQPVEPFPGFAPAKSMVFAGLYPMDASEYDKLSEALERLTLNDASVSVVKETSSSLGQGFRLGFLGTLHMDVFRQRLEEEHEATVINTAPTVPFRVLYKDGSEKLIRNPAEFPEIEELSKVDHFLEPMVLGTLVFPEEYLGSLMDLCGNHRGEQVDFTYIDDSRVMIKYKLPMSEILTEFYDQLKSRTSGYASFDYEEIGYEEADMVKINLLLNGKPVDALSTIVHRVQAERVAKIWVKRLKKVVQRQLFEVAIQASINGKIVARESVTALRKDVTAKCYGGDITRKMKLLEKQKAGKKKLKAVAGGVQLPQEAFLTLMSGQHEDD
ncbi:P-loop containing nucleoside triphosphate hydrolase protein [Polychytrium aggregatum]|uniref:P-loop containing nucleoside triphosphate hydrolase protein n=1 Tax=Polychytrium aggregatum TaxID=110093 RepID=UPI0022FE556E|nr:P-loop containing nucleoside triphosphate hydrolase protein [Polychytrium aggregatum]KAI9204416.1 P-loop containing nucleoside triphosphate hydrolase protein [Polychytrium aggregatum]